MIWLMVFPLPAAYPDKLGELVVTVQAKVDPVTVDVRFIAVVIPEQIVWESGSVDT
jgi:hypothetical protein